MEERPELEVFFEQIQAIHGQLTEIGVGEPGSAPAVDGEPRIEWQIENPARAELLATLSDKTIANDPVPIVTGADATVGVPSAAAGRRTPNTRLWRTVSWAAAACVVLGAGGLTVLMMTQAVHDNGVHGHNTWTNYAALSEGETDLGWTWAFTDPAAPSTEPASASTGSGPATRLLADVSAPSDAFEGDADSRRGLDLNHENGIEITSSNGRDLNSKWWLRWLRAERKHRDE